jgi:hypothetical protein
MGTTPSDIASALADAARTLDSVETVEEVLDAIVQAARVSVPGVDEVSISVVNRDQSMETKAGTGQLVWEMDEAQYRFREGPCVDALLGGPLVVAHELRHDQRWPNYVPVAVKAGVKSQLAVQLPTRNGAVAGLNLYSTTSDAVAPEAPHVAEMFANHAALALGHVRKVSNLSEAIASRQEIGIAIGLVMAKYRIDRNRAFQFLTRASSTSQVKVRDIAREVIETAEESFGSSSE